MTHHESQRPVPVAQSGYQSVSSSGWPKHRHFTLPRCCNGFKPLLNGEPYALKGARTVREGEAGK